MRAFVRLMVTAVAVAIAVGLSACSSTPEPEPELPEGAITVQQNVPTPVEGGELVAYNISADSAWLSVVPTGESARKQEVRVGDTVEVGEAEFTVHAIDAGSDDQAAPGAGSGQVVVVPVTG